jgi:hypothetical protein
MVGQALYEPKYDSLQGVDSSVLQKKTFAILPLLFYLSKAENWKTAKRILAKVCLKVL